MIWDRIRSSLPTMRRIATLVSHRSLPTGRPLTPNRRRTTGLFMKTRLTFLAMVLLLTGCSSITGTRSLPDGTTLSVKSYRFFWSSESISAGTEDANGFKFTLTVGKSTTDATTLGAVAKGVAEGITKGAAP